MALSENPTLEEIVDEVERLNNLIVNRGGAQTITPSTSNKTLNKGYYKGNITIKGDSNLVASNILSGKSIFGVAGNVTVSSLGGKKWASGTATSQTGLLSSSSAYAISIRNLAFKPSYVIAVSPSTSSRSFSIYAVNFPDTFKLVYKASSGSPAIANDKNYVLYDDGAVLYTGSSARYDWIAFE